MFEVDDALMTHWVKKGFKDGNSWEVIFRQIRAWSWRVALNPPTFMDVGIQHSHSLLILCFQPHLVRKLPIIRKMPGTGASYGSFCTRYDQYIARKSNLVCKSRHFCQLFAFLIGYGSHAPSICKHVLISLVVSSKNPKLAQIGLYTSDFGRYTSD